MRIYLTLLGLFVSLGLPVTAQVSVEVLLDQTQFLRDESLPVNVRITNRSGQRLQIGQEKNWLTFNLENRDGVLVARLGEIPVEGELSLESARQATRRLDLMPYYDLSVPGRYRISATVKIKQWDQEVSSAPKEFDIVRGVKIWEEDFGVSVGGKAPEPRKYLLQQATFLKQLKLYVRITDLSENQVFRVVAAGSTVSFSRPEHEIDRESNLHLLFQTGARSFSYCKISPDGDLLLRQTHDYSPDRPVLRLNENGRVQVTGGARRLVSDDFPPAAPTSTNDVKTARP